MKPRLLRTLLTFSVLINIGVLGAFAYRTLSPDNLPGLPRQLGLDASQTQRWHETEREFLVQLADGATAIQAHRDRMIHAIFAEAPDLALIDAERTAIAALQDTQQKRVIEQLLRERELLDAAQRIRLVRLLLAQPAAPSSIERLHSN